MRDSDQATRAATSFAFVAVTLASSAPWLTLGRHGLIFAPLSLVAVSLLFLTSAVPAYLLLIRCWPATWLACTVGGAFVAELWASLLVTISGTPWRDAAADGRLFGFAAQWGAATDLAFWAVLRFLHWAACQGGVWRYALRTFVGATLVLIFADLFVPLLFV